MIVFLGDIHGEAWVLKKFLDDFKDNVYVTAIIQVGDFGLFPQNKDEFIRAVKDSHIPVYFIDGNHDDCNRWVRFEEVRQVYPDVPLYYIPRGTVMTFEDKTYVFMGGAASIDKALRLRDGSFWVDEENIRPEDIARLTKNLEGVDKVDFFITHTPPLSVVNRHFNPIDKLQFNVSVDWIDNNMIIVEELWELMGKPFNISGHMHKRVLEPGYRILDINERFGV